MPFWRLHIRFLSWSSARSRQNYNIQSKLRLGLSSARFVNVDNSDCWRVRNRTNNRT